MADHSKPTKLHKHRCFLLLPLTSCHGAYPIVHLRAFLWALGTQGPLLITYNKYQTSQLSLQVFYSLGSHPLYLISYWHIQLSLYWDILPWAWHICSHLCYHLPPCSLEIWNWLMTKLMDFINFFFFFVFQDRFLYEALELGMQTRLALNSDPLASALIKSMCCHTWPFFFEGIHFKFFKKGLFVSVNSHGA